MFGKMQAVTFPKFNGRRRTPRSRWPSSNLMRIRDWPKAGAWLGFALSVLFAGVMVPLTTFDLWSGRRWTRPVARCSRCGCRDVACGTTRSSARASSIGASLPRAARRSTPATGGSTTPTRSGRRPPSLGLLLGLGIAYFMLGMLLTSYLRNFGYRGRRLRTQLTMLGCLVAAAALYKTYLLLTPYSPYWLPIGAFSISVAVHHDRQVAFAGTVGASRSSSAR